MYKINGKKELIGRIAFAEISINLTELVVSGYQLRFLRGDN
jgi:hypothetical protein